MDINVKNDTLSVCRAVCHIKSDFTTECDVIVPDSNPDISRILQVSARAVMTSCETQTDRVIISGRLNLNILYLADNEEKSVKAIETSCAFSNLFQHKDIGEDMLTVADVDVSEISYTLSNCRKLTVKTILSGKVKVYSCSDAEFVSEIEGAKTKSTQIASTIISSHAESTTTLTDSFELSQGKMCISEILKADAKINDSDIKIIDDKAIIKGAVSVTTLYNAEEGIDFIETELPFAHVIDAAGVRPDMSIDYDVKVTDVLLSASTDVNGEKRVIDVSCDLFFRVLARETVNVNCITDVYIPRGAISCKSRTLFVSGIENTVHNEVNFKESVILPDTLSPIDTVYEILARPFIENCEISGDKLKITGYTEVYVLYLSREETAPVFSYKTNIDFSVITDAPDCSLKPVADCRVRGISFVLSGERSLEVRGSIEITTQCVRDTEIDIICEAEEAEYTPVKRPSIIVSYVSEVRKLWDIAKEYNIDENDILNANAIENEADILPGMALIIPK